MFLIVIIVVILSSFKKSDNQINFNKWKITTMEVRHLMMLTLKVK